ncbi:limbin [Pelodytes ibericus]
MVDWWPGWKSPARLEDSSLPLMSAAAGSVWSHSVFAGVSSWMKRMLFKRAVLNGRSQRQDVTLDANNIIFQKCASVNTLDDPQTAYISLVTNSTDLSSSATSLSNLILQDNITGLIVKDVSYNTSSSADGIQMFKKVFLKAGEYFLIQYTASLNANVAESGMAFLLPGRLTYQNSSQVASATSFSNLANFTITAQQSLEVINNHGIHFAGFVIALIVSFILTCAVFFVFYHIKRGQQVSNREFVKIRQQPETKLEPADNVIEDYLLSEKMIDILAFEEPENMLQALEDSEIANLTHADADLEACRTHIYKDAMGILLRNVTAVLNHPSLEKRLIRGFNEAWLNLEKRIQEEHQRKMVALTAECNLDTRKQMDMQYRKQKAASEEAEEITKNVGEKSFTEYRLALDKLHGLEQAEMKRLLLCKQEEEFAKAYRLLNILHRSELHGIFFDQMQDSASRGEMKEDVQKMLIENYLKVQEEEEAFLDLMQATKKYHMNNRFAVRKNLIYSIQLCDSRSRCLLNTAATQIASLIHKTERAGHVSESQAELLLQKAQAEVLKVKEKLENVLKAEKRKLHQKLSTKRKRHLVQKLKEQRKGQSTIQEASRTSKEVSHYLEHWKPLFSDQLQEMEEVIEQHDNNAVEEVKALRCSLTEKAIEDLCHIQNAVIMPDLLKLSVPRMHLQQVIEEHKSETALLVQQLETEETDKASDARTSLESTKRKLEDELKLTIKEQKNLRQWEQLLFTKILLLPLSLCKEDVHKIRQAFQCGFSQMDISLALPKIQGRRLLQTYLAEWRHEQIHKIDQRLLEMEKQPYSKMKKPPQGKAVEVLKKSAEDKILIYEAQITDDKIKQARGELLLHRVHQLKAREYKLGEYITSIQFQMVNTTSKTLEIHIALVHLQSLLLEEISRSQFTPKSEYEQLLQAQSREIQDIDQSLEIWVQKEALIDKQVENAKMNLAAETLSKNDKNLPLSASLRAALIPNLNRDRIQMEEMECSLLENEEERGQMDTFLRLYNQDIRLAAYLTKGTMLPQGMLHRILNLLLPSSTENEILSVLYSLGHKYSGSVTETDNNEDDADSWRKRKHQELWTVIEKRLKEGLVSPEQERNTFTGRKKRSILKKRRLRPVKRVSFSHTENFSQLLQSYGHSPPFGSTEALNLPDTGEKLFIFTVPSQSPTSSSKPKKKRNFLNSKKTTTYHV